MSKTERKTVVKGIKMAQAHLTELRRSGRQYGEAEVDATVAEIDRLARMLPENQW